MIKSFLRLTKLTLFLSLLLPLVLALCGRFAKDAPITNSFTAKAFLLAAVVMIVYTILTFLCARFEPTVTRLSAEQVRFLDEMPQRYVSFAIVATAALSLFLE